MARMAKAVRAVAGWSYSRGCCRSIRPERAQRIEGWVRIEIEVSPSGTVSAARVVAASPERVFDEAALKAIRRWRFQPAFSEGRAVSQRATLTMRFRLEERGRMTSRVSAG